MDINTVGPSDSQKCALIDGDRHLQPNILIYRSEAISKRGCPSDAIAGCSKTMPMACLSNWTMVHIHLRRSSGSTKKVKSIYQDSRIVAVRGRQRLHRSVPLHVQREVIDRYEFDSIYHTNGSLIDIMNGKKNHKKEGLAPWKRHAPNHCSKIYPVPLENENY